MRTATETKITTTQHLLQLHTVLPASWRHAAGLLRHHQKALKTHINSMRREWNRRKNPI